MYRLYSKAQRVSHNYVQPSFFLPLYLSCYTDRASSANAANDKPPPYDNFNTHLSSNARVFATSHPDATVLLFSSAATFNALLDEPLAYGFEESDRHKADGGIWYDRLHPTSKVHDFVARDFAEFLASVESPPPL